MAREPRVLGLAHVGVAGDGLGSLLDLLGAPQRGAEDVPEQGVRVAFHPLGSARVELLVPLAEGEGPVGRFLLRHGPGLHHLALAVEGLDVLLARLRAAGVRLIDETPRPGADGTRVAFIHPSSAGGVLVELVEAPLPPAPDSVCS